MASHAAAASLRLEAVASGASHPAQVDGEFIAFKASMRLPIAPVFASKGDNLFPGHDGGMDGVREVLAGWVMRYLPPLRAVLLSFSPTPRFLHPAQRFRSSRVPFDSLYESGDDSDDDDDDDDLQEDQHGHQAPSARRTVLLKSLPMVDGSGFTLANVEWEGVGWRPRVGMRLVGTLTLASASHVSLLLHNLFNASIPVSHIPTDTWEWDPDCAVPPVVLERRNAALPFRQVVSDVVEKANEAAEAEEGEGEEDGTDSKDKQAEVARARAEEAEEEEAEFAERGWWVHRKSREPLGGQDGRLEFTLVGLTTSNSLLSCTGSLLADPFSPSAVASLQSSLITHLSASSTLVQTRLSTKGKKRARDDDEAEEVLGGGRRSGTDSDSDSDSDSDEGLDADDDDRVGTGIPRGHGAQAIPRFNEDDSDDDKAASESSRSPSPEAEPVPPVVKKSKKKAAAAAVAAKEEGEEAKPKKKAGRSKKVKAE